jgi:fatty-acid peroxygenase
MRTATSMLARQMCYALPRQNLNVDFRRLPALPRSGTILSDVQIRTSDSTNSH